MSGIIESQVGRTFYEPHDWRELSACLGIKPEVFMLERDPDIEKYRNDTSYLSQVKAAKAICADCVVREECLMWAIENPDKPDVPTVRGGLTQSQRNTFAKKLKILAAA